MLPSIIVDRTNETFIKDQVPRIRLIRTIELAQWEDRRYATCLTKPCVLNHVDNSLGELNGCRWLFCRRLKNCKLISAESGQTAILRQNITYPDRNCF